MQGDIWRDFFMGFDDDLPQISWDLTGFTQIERAKLVYNSSNNSLWMFMVDTAIVSDAYKPTYY